jgi:hypothetical protein
MNATSEIHLLEIPIGGNAGRTWNRLHNEREDVCEALLKDRDLSVDESVASDDEAAKWHRVLLQSRLKEIDDALDRLMVKC